MKTWKDKETGIVFSEPDCTDEWLQAIWAIGIDYDGYEKPENLKALIDELVSFSQKARECLREGKLFPKEQQAPGGITLPEPTSWIESSDMDDAGNPLPPHINCPYCGFYWREAAHKKVFHWCPNCGNFVHQKEEKEK